MRDEVPVSSARGRGAERAGRVTHAPHPHARRREAEREPNLLANPRESRRQVAVGAERPHDERFPGRRGRVEAGIDEVQEHVGPAVVGREAGAARRVPEGVAVVAALAVAEVVERFIFHIRAGRRSRGHASDREDLVARRVTDFRGNPVFGPRVSQRDRLGRPFEQVRRRRTPEPDHPRVEQLLQPRVRAVEEDHHVDLFRRAEGRACCVPSGDVHIEELRGVCEVLGEEPVTGEDVRRVRQYRVGRFKADRPYCVGGRERDDRPRSVGRDERDLDRMVQEQVVKRRGKCVLADEVEPQRVEL